MPATRKATASRASSRPPASSRGRDWPSAPLELCSSGPSQPPSVSRKRSTSAGKRSSAPTRIATTTATSVSCPAAACRRESVQEDRVLGHGPAGDRRSHSHGGRVPSGLVPPPPDEPQRGDPGDHGHNQRRQRHALRESPEDALRIEMQDNKPCDRDGAGAEPRPERSRAEAVGEGVIAMACGVAAEEDGRRCERPRVSAWTD
jgi:hypothetical protein